MNERPILGFDTYRPQAAAAVHTVEQPCGILGMALTPSAIEARRAEEECHRRLMQEVGLKALATSDPEQFEELFPNVIFMRQ